MSYRISTSQRFPLHFQDPQIGRYTLEERLEIVTTYLESNSHVGQQELKR